MTYKTVQCYLYIIHIVRVGWGGRRGFVLFAKPLFHPTNETPLIQIMMCFRHIYHCRFALPLPEPNVQSGSPDVKGILLAS